MPPHPRINLELIMVETHCGGQSLERREDLPKLITLVHADVTKAATALLPACQSLLCLQVHEVSERALLGQTGHARLQRTSHHGHTIRQLYSLTGSSHHASR